jgi:hypothetical protein
MKKEKYLFIGHDIINDKIEVDMFDDVGEAEDEVDNFEQHLMPAMIIPFSKLKS